MLPSVVKHSLVVGYADDHTLIPAKNDRVVAADHLNADLTALYEYGQLWNIIFAPAKTSSLVIFLKTGISEHPTLFLNNIQIPEVTSVINIRFFVYLAETYR